MLGDRTDLRLVGEPEGGDDGIEVRAEGCVACVADAIRDRVDAPLLGDHIRPDVERAVGHTRGGTPIRRGGGSDTRHANAALA